LLYALVALTIKRKKLNINRNGCINQDKMTIIWPLGYYKFHELEIEVAKLKDFDAEYKLLVYV